MRGSEVASMLSVTGGLVEGCIGEQEKRNKCKGKRQLLFLSYMSKVELSISLIWSVVSLQQVRRRGSVMGSVIDFTYIYILLYFPSS